MNVVAPPLALGVAVHETLEHLLTVPAQQRFAAPLVSAFEKNWQKVAGKLGGFLNEADEATAKARGRAMIERVERNPGPLANKTIRLSQELPSYFISAADNIMLCGKVDWLEHIPADDSVHVIDFKTGHGEEREDSLQLPIYSLLLANVQKRRVSGASYWYLERDDAPKPVALPDPNEAYERVIQVAREMKRAREQKKFVCPRGEGGCYACQPFEKIVRGEAEHVGVGGYNQDLYLIH
jgi:ATP-dependent exoDNAse (exonuclease V) beta subunit